MSDEKARIAVILAGGEGRRMACADKGALVLNGKRLIDHVIEKLAPQADRILISAPHDYQSGFAFLPDRAEGPTGPAAGVWSMLHWLVGNAPKTDGFLTAPVDGPFLPRDLFVKLCNARYSAIAHDEAGLHPTFAWWRVEDLRGAFRDVKRGEGLSLKGLAKEAGAREIDFPGNRFFRNVNTPADLAEAEALAAGESDL